MSSKFWLRAGTTAVLSVALSTTIAMAQDHDRDHDRDDDRWHEHDRDHDRDHDYDHDRGRHEGYVDHDRDIRAWYHDHYRHLPPGLAKRDRLPPGLERQLVVHGYLPVELRERMQPCPHELEVMLPPAAPGFAHVFIGGSLVLVNRANFQVADVFHFDVNY
jgi:hypothetical protein